MLQPTFDVILCDFSAELARAWRRAFAEFPEVQVVRGDPLDVKADAYVSPANSFGFMDGGIDATLSERFPHIERRVQTAITEVGGILPVGRALVVETGDAYTPYLVCAPTMETPSHVGHTNNAFRAMSALLDAVERFNNVESDAIGSAAIPGLCTGVGGMESEVAAFQMARAYEEWHRRRE